MGSNESEPILEDSETELSIQGRGLEFIPNNIPPHHPLKTLLAAHNQLSLIPQTLLHLENLDVSYNDLGKTIPFQAILDYPELRNLFISGNYLTRFPADLRKFNKMTDIVADRNRFTDQEDVFKDLSNLENADLTLNFFKNIPVFQPSIVSINVSFNFIRSVDLSLLPNLRELRLSGNEIRSISESCSFPILTYLDLSLNDLATLPPISKFAPSIETLLIPYNALKEFPQDLPLTIIKLDVSNNQIVKFETSLEDHTNLKTLDVSKNKITQLPSLPSTLETFNADNNQIETSAEIKMKKLRAIGLKYNNLKSLPVLTECTANSLGVGHNKLEKIELEKIGKAITRFDFSVNLIKEVPLEMFAIEKLHTIDITCNLVTKLPDSIANSSIQSLYISENNISALPKLPQSLMTIKAIRCAFTELPDQIMEINRLSFIDFSNNKIRNIKALPKCRHIGLSCNLLTTLPEIPEVVVSLDVSHNMLKEIKITGDMNLRELDFSYNKVDNFQTPMLTFCNTLKVSNNPLGKFTLSFEKFPSLSCVEATNTKMKLPSKLPPKFRCFITSQKSFFTKQKSPCVNLMSIKKAGFADTIGTRPTMEDSVIIREGFDRDIDIYAVIDGHGGSDTACFTAYLIPQYFAAEKKNSIACFPSVVTRLNDKLRKLKVRDGATISFAIVKPKEISCAYLGDTRAIIINRDKSITQLSYDHKPTNPSEVSIIKGNRSYVYDKRTAGILAVSRALGDLNVEGVSHIPDMTVHFRKPTDYRLVIACDGVFDVVTHEEVAKIIMEIPDPSLAAATIRNIALSRMTQDNVSVIVVNIEIK